jgi:hypothetical protein
MVGELHELGFQRLRVSPGMAPTGMHWRCTITSVDNIQPRHGALIVNWDDPYVVLHVGHGQPLLRMARRC